MVTLQLAEPLQFAQQRDQAILDRFNKNGWVCQKCKMDPCMFCITRCYSEDGIEQERRAWVVVHVDDCDMAGETD